MTRPSRDKYWKLWEITSRGDEIWECRNHPRLNDGQTEITFITNPESGFRELSFTQPHFLWGQRSSRPDNRPSYILLNPNSGEEKRHYRNQSGQHREDGPAIIECQKFGSGPGSPRSASYYYYLNDKPAAGPFGASCVKFLYQENAGPNDNSIMIERGAETNLVGPNDPERALTEKEARHFRPKPLCP